MIALMMYEEFSHGHGFKHLADDFSATKYDGQDAVAEYLKNGNVTAVAAGIHKDVFTGENTEPILLMNDGEYGWANYLAHYVEKYNLKLPDDFIRHVLDARN